MTTRRLLHAASSPTGLTHRSVVRLGSLLGQINQQVDMIELAVAHFIESALAHPTGEASFIADLKKRNKVPSKGGPMALLRRTSRLYLLQGVAIASHFAISFRKEYVSLSGAQVEWADKRRSGSKLSPLEQLKENLPNRGGLVTSARTEFALLEYYRDCRNSYLHMLDLGDVTLAHERLMSTHGAELKAQFYRVPSAPNEVRHGDYVLLGRALIHLAQKVSASSPLTAEHAANGLMADASVMKALRTQKGNPERLNKRAALHAARLFWATPNASKAVAAIVGRSIGKEPTARERRASRSKKKL
jgi:hypothetical protein